MARDVKNLITAVMLACCSSLGWALGPAEPFVAPTFGQAEASGQQSGAVADDNGVVSGLSGVRLGRQAGAVIDGQWVRKGRMVRGARLIDVQRTRVTLLHPDGRKEVIQMYPPVGGQAAAKASASTEASKP
ncbi:MAG TPA: hypothetical protein VFM48_02105 [Aquabacterium sp.]|nr:hypothetical protein [Aquabacterium sp.]